MVLGVDGDLYIVADGSGAFAASSHRTGVGIGQRDLLIGCLLNRLLHHLQGLHLSAQAGNLLLQSDRLGLGDIALFAVGSVQCSQVPRDAGVDLLHPPNDLGDRVIFVAIVHALNLLPSIATTARVNRLSWRHNTTNWEHTARIAPPLSLRKSAIVLKSGASRPVSHISSVLRCASRSSRRLDCTRLR